MVQTANPAGPRPTAPARAAEPRLSVTVVFTGVSATLAALRRAGELAGDLGTAIRVFDVHVVPYPLPLSEPATDRAHLARRFQTLAGNGPVETTFEILLCRDRVEALRGALAPGSLVVIGAKGRWWPTRESRLARHLRKAGFEVLFLDCPREKKHA